MPFRVPEYAFQAILLDLRERLKDDTYWTRQTAIFEGVPEQVVTDFRAKLRKKPLNVAFTFPVSDADDLPTITLMAEDESVEQAFLNEQVDDLGEEVGVVASTDTDGTVVASATAGQTTGVIPHGNIAAESLLVYKNAVLLAASAYTLDATSGRLTFAPALAASDKITADYSYYKAAGEQVYGEVVRRQTRLFLFTDHPEDMMLLACVVRRELFVKKATYEAAGIDNLAVRMMALSAWTEILPAVGVQRQLVLDYVYQQTAEIEPTPIRKVTVSDTTTTDTTVVEVTTEMTRRGVR